MLLLQCGLWRLSVPIGLLRGASNPQLHLFWCVFDGTRRWAPAPNRDWWCADSHTTPAGGLTGLTPTREPNLTLTPQPPDAHCNPSPNPNYDHSPPLQVRDIKAHIWGQICGCPTGQAGELITVDADKGTLACYKNTAVPGRLVARNRQTSTATAVIDRYLYVLLKTIRGKTLNETVNETANRELK